MNRIDNKFNTPQRQKSQKKTNDKSPTRKSANKPEIPKTVKNADDIRFKIVNALREIDSNQLSFNHKSRKLFVEHVLEWEFGESIESISDKNALIDSIIAQIGEDETIIKNFDSLLRNLKRQVIK